MTHRRTHVRLAYLFLRFTCYEFQGRTVAIKRLKKRSVHLTREVLIQLKQVILPRLSSHKANLITVYLIIANFTVVCLVIWPWIGSEAGGDLVLIQTSLLFICRSCFSYASLHLHTSSNQR